MPHHPHLLVALSGHGFGHLAQAAPVLEALVHRLPALRLTIQGALPEAVVRARVQGPFEYVDASVDVGLVMVDALTVDTAATHAAYRDFHADWAARLDRETRRLETLAPDLVLADVPYLPLAAAERLGLPRVALCSLNWADILESYWPAEPALRAPVDLMRGIYARVDAFLRPEPAMPMTTLPTARAIGPVASVGRHRRPEIDARLGLPPGATLVVVGLGGVPIRLPLQRWPRLTGVHWLVPGVRAGERPDLHPRESLANMPFVDLVASCDALLTKSGYGSFVEAACCATPVLYVHREDWPEEPYLRAWIETHATAVAVDPAALNGGNLAAPLARVLARKRPPAVLPTGVQEAVESLRQSLLGG